MQEIIVAIIGIAVLVYIGWRLYNMFIRKSGPRGKCAGCYCDCALRQLPDTKGNKKKKEVCGKRGSAS